MSNRIHKKKSTYRHYYSKIKKIKLRKPKRKIVKSSKMKRQTHKEKRINVTLNVTRQCCMQEGRELIFKVFGKKNNFEFHFVFYKYSTQVYFLLKKLYF